MLNIVYQCYKIIKTTTNAMSQKKIPTKVDGT